MKNLKTISAGVLFGLAISIFMMFNQGNMTLDKLAEGWQSLFESEAGRMLTALFFFLIVLLIYKFMKKQSDKRYEEALEKKKNEENSNRLR